MYCRAPVDKVITCILRKLAFLGKPCCDRTQSVDNDLFRHSLRRSGENNNMYDGSLSAEITNLRSIFSVFLSDFSLRRTADLEAFDDFVNLAFSLRSALTAVSYIDLIVSFSLFRE